MPVEATTITAPIAAQELLKSLSDYHTALPVSNAIKQQVLRSLHHPNTSAARVARAVAGDPALSLQVLFNANELLARQGLEAKYLDHCISLIGLPKVEQIVRTAPEYADNSGYEEQLNQSWMAANLARGLQLTSLDEDKELLFFSCLAIRFHELALWSQYPHEMEQVERLKANPIYDHEHIEKRVFGLTFNEIGKQLASRWPLFQITQQCWQEGFQLSDSRNSDYINQNNCIKLCHVVSSLGSRSWYHPETLAAEELLAKEARTDISKVLYQTRQSCIQAPCNGWKPHPAARLLMHWEHQKNLVPLFWETTKPPTDSSRKDVTQQEPQHQELKQQEPQRQSARPEHTAAPEKKQTPLQETTAELAKLDIPYDEPSEFEERLNRLNYQGSSFADLNELLLFSLDTLHNIMNANQSMILVLNSERSHLRFQYCQGADALSGKTIELSAKQTTLFQKLLTQPGSLRIDSNNLHQCIRQLSPRLASIFASEHSALMSLFHNRQPLGIMFIKKSPLSNADFTDFKKIGSATNGAIAEVARVRHRRAL